MSNERDIETTDEEQAVDEHLLPPSYRQTWGNDMIRDEPKSRPFNGRVGFLLAFDRVKQFIDKASKPTRRVFWGKIWPSVKKSEVFFLSKRQWFAFLLLVVCGIVPFSLFGYYTRRSSTGGVYPFASTFQAKVLSCGDAIGEAQNSTVAGIEALFTLDSTWGKFPFSQVKIINIAWEIFVARGVQLLAWWASYVVFSDALLRVIERRPTSYEIFAHICLQGPSLATMWTLIRDLIRKRTKGTWALFLYLLISTTYVLCIPAFLTAMTGYDSTQVAWIDIDSHNNIVPANSFEYEPYILFGVNNETLSTPSCSAAEGMDELNQREGNMRRYCDCQIPNGTLLEYRQWIQRWPYTGYDRDQCVFQFPGNNQTYEVVNYTSSKPDTKTYKCNDTLKLKIDDREYERKDLNTSSGYCHEDVGYTFEEISDKSRCLPDTAYPSYKWGFSTMLSGVWVITHLIWCLSMYAVWQDAQSNCEMVKKGLSMTQLRAAFVLTEAAKQKMELGGNELIREDIAQVEGVLFKEAEIDRGLFAEPKGLWYGHSPGLIKRKETRSQISEI